MKLNANSGLRAKPDIALGIDPTLKSAMRFIFMPCVFMGNDLIRGKVGGPAIVTDTELIC
jgi:hypothetical protein